MTDYTLDFTSTTPVRFRHVITLVDPTTDERTLVFFYADDDGIDYDHLDTAMGDPLPDAMLDWFVDNVEVSSDGSTVSLKKQEVAR
jgi:hypothetical protein